MFISRNQHERSSFLAGLIYRSILINHRNTVRQTAFLTNSEMCHRLTTHRKISSYTIGICSVCCHVLFIHCQNQRKIASRRMTGNKNVILTTTILLNILENPCHSFSRIFDVSRILCFRTQTVIHRHYCKPLFSQFFGNKFISTFHTTTVKPDNS